MIESESPASRRISPFRAARVSRAREGDGLRLRLRRPFQFQVRYSVFRKPFVNRVELYSIVCTLTGRQAGGRGTSAGN